MSAIDEILNQTNMLHEPIKVPDDIDSDELKKEVVTEKNIGASDQNQWQHEKRGSLEIPADGEFILKAPSRYDTWAPGDPEDGDYVGYGNTRAVLKIDHENWENYNRLAFTIDTRITYAIPFCIAPLISTVVAYAATAFGWMHATYILIPWVTPPILSGYLATGGDIRASLVQIVIIAINVALYVPFVIASNHQYQTKMEKEADMAEKTGVTASDEDADAESVNV